MARQLTAKETFLLMVQEGCFRGGNLVKIPEWLTYPMLQGVIAAGYVDPLISIGAGSAAEVREWA